MSSLRVSITPTQSGIIRNTLLNASVEKRSPLPLSEAVGFLRAAVGGELVEGARALMSGSPGGGKSRAATQLCLDLGRQGIPTLTLLTEEGPAQLKRRAMQLSADWPTAQATRAMAAMYADATVFDSTLLPEFLMRQVLSQAGTYHGVKLIVLDSIQGHGLAASATKTYAKVLEFARLCEENRIATLMLCHVTKRGDIAGPKSLEHSVDISMILRRAMRYSLLAVRKNRYGPLLLKPMPLRLNPVTTRLEPAPHCEPRPAMARTYAGPGTGVLEMQAAVAVPGDGAKGRMTAPGLPRREIEQLVSCIAGMSDIDFGELDYTLHCRRPGSGPYQPSFGLPLCMALIASFIRENVPENHLYLGEIDLFRHVRRLPPDLITGLRSALDAGDIQLPVTVHVPVTDALQLSDCGKGVTVVGCRTLEDAVFNTWPNLR
jgi:DNA repair protein RadA/Sms